MNPPCAGSIPVVRPNLFFLINYSLQKDFFLVNVSQLPPIFFCKDEERNSIFSPIYYGDEESNYHYIYSFFYFFFQVQDNPKGLWVFFYQLGPFLHHPHVDGLQGS